MAICCLFKRNIGKEIIILFKKSSLFSHVASDLEFSSAERMLNINQIINKSINQLDIFSIIKKVTRNSGGIQDNKDIDEV